jgi:3-deoxy-D-manno-octulosonic-acid transferase
MTTLHSSTTRALFFYRLFWFVLAPLLRFHKRMKIGYQERILKKNPAKADLWIQAASVGEAYIVEEILLLLDPQTSLTILVTTNTSQGMDILKKIQPSSANITLTLHYCPFDHPGLMHQAVTAVQPRLVVLIETELWPGFLAACKKQHIPICVINGRMTEKSMKGYLRMAGFWQDLAPDSILAMSESDRQRYGMVFGNERTEIMANIKFDRLLRTATAPTDPAPLSTIIEPETPFLILGSTRTEEEEVISQMIESLLRHNPRVVIGLFPRHMERISTWQQHLTKQQIPFQLRSTISSPITEGTVILWDTIGELQQGYHRADGAFVGGSLVPLGGQNFLEPLSAGIQPVIGNSWSNFYWVGEEIFQENLVFKVDNWQEAVNVLLNGLQQPTNHIKVQQKFTEYARQQQGGTATACAKIMHLLQQ